MRQAMRMVQRDISTLEAYTRFQEREALLLLDCVNRDHPSPPEAVFTTTISNTPAVPCEVQIPLPAMDTTSPLSLLSPRVEAGVDDVLIFRSKTVE